MMKNAKIVVYSATYGKPYTLELYDVFCTFEIGRLSQTERNNLNLNELEDGETIIDNQGRTIDWQGYIVASDNQV